MHNNYRSSIRNIYVRRDSPGSVGSIKNRSASTIPRVSPIGGVLLYDIDAEISTQEPRCKCVLQDLYFTKNSHYMSFNWVTKC